LYSKPITIVNSTTLKAAVIKNGKNYGEITTANYFKSKKIKNISLEKKFDPKYFPMVSLQIINNKRGSLDFNDKEW